MIRPAFLACLKARVSVFCERLHMLRMLRMLRMLCCLLQNLRSGSLQLCSESEH